MVGQSTQQRADRAARRIHGAIGIGADLASGDECRRLVEEAVAALGGLDVLVSNAAVTGAAAIMPLDELDDARLDRIIDVNLKAPIRLARAAMPHMRRGGVIVNVSSVGGLAAQYRAVAYSASKGGLEVATRALALEAAERGIRVVSVAPGDIVTGRDAAATEARSGASFEAYRRQNPLGRRGRPKDIAQGVAFLVSDAAGYITGTTVVIDGGRLAY